jgi:iron complex outermembrane receptor protein
VLSVASLWLRGQDAAESLKSLSLDDLSAVEVTSVSRRSEKLVDAAAAVQVLTGDRIIRAGAMTLPDALRLATGVQVSQLDGREWAISARGFASLASDKMEVSQDGRSLYGPLFSGVLWDVQSVVLEDLDRIEVIRGPGAALWGSNAVNGVINIVTKPASETQGTLAVTTIGSDYRQGVVRYGGSLHDGGFYRVYAHGWTNEGLELSSGANAGDDRRMAKAGGRADLPVGSEGLLTFQSDVYRGLLGQVGLPQSTVTGGNAIARYEVPLSSAAKLRVQTNYDYTDRQIPKTYSEIRNTGEVFAEFEANTDRFSGTVGTRARVSADRIGNGLALDFIPTARTLGLYSLYAQGRLALPDRHWKLTAGTTLEHNTYTGFEVQPTTRLSFSPEANWMGWIGASRAVRTPSRVDADIDVPGPGGLTILRGSPDIVSEDLDALETGWRWSKEEKLTIEANVFVDRYRHLRSLEPAGGNVLFVNRNLLKGESQGGELTATLKPRPSVRIIFGARVLNKTLELLPESRSPNPGNYEGNDARRIATVQGSFDLSAKVQFDVVVRHMSALPQPAVPGYTDADVRLAWDAGHDWELAVSGRNLLHASHAEGAQTTAPVESVRRSLAFTATWRR